jgi:dolichyl-phosphate-mannose--protein O-mannosyl transferase
LTKKDVTAIILISVVFFGIAAWNVGSIQYPQTSWQSTQNESFYINLGSTQQVKTVYCWVVSGNGTANISSGTPGNWNNLGSLVLEPAGTNYQVFVSLDVNTNTQYLSFNITSADYDSRPMFSTSGITNPSDNEPSPFLKISEIGIQSQNNEQIKIAGITGENTTDPTLTKMVDEQNSLQIPPTYMEKMYFDEVYFARSAENYLHHQIPDERTHPPLGKLIQASGLVVFGDNPFGWRILGVIFATLIIPLMYLLGKKLFGTWIGGFSAAFLLTFDFMHFTMARIGTADTYVVFFALLSQLFFLIYFVNVAKNGWKTSIVPLFLTVIFFGLGFSTKWFTLFGAAGMLVLLIALRLRDVKNLKGTLGDKYVAFFNYPAFILLGFIGIAVGIYFVTYIPDVLAGDSWATIFSLQNAMFGFHSGLTSPDSFSSPWWSWPFMVRPGGNVPRWFDITYLPNNVDSTISAFGNPIVWWIGFAAVVVLMGIVIYKSGILQGIAAKKLTSKFNLRQTDLPIVFITVVFLFSWLPYALISRATYTYHFYLSVPLLCLALTYFINKYWEKPIGKIAAIAIFATTVGMFIAFFPVISGMPVSNGYIHNLKWFQSWFFAP